MIRHLFAAGALAFATLGGANAASADEIGIAVSGPNGSVYFGAWRDPSEETIIVPPTPSRKAVPVADLYERDLHGRGAGYYDPPPPPVRPRHAGRRHGFGPGYAYPYRACLPRWKIRRKLRRQGWRDFHNLVIRRWAVKVNARRPNGLLYRLKIDRCRGVILKARLLNRGWRPWRPWRHDRFTHRNHARY